MTNDKKREGPLSLDMSFDEALGRFAQTDPKEAAQEEAKSKGVPLALYSGKLPIGDVELDGGQGRDFLIGGQSTSELWGGPDSDTFDLSRESSGLQRIMDFDPTIDQILLDQRGGSYEINVQGEDLWLVNGDRTVAVFNDLADQYDAVERLIG